MSRVKVKICGIRTLEDASAAVETGADALGFNFWPRSSRFVEPSVAREVIAGLSHNVCTVGVFVNEDANRIVDIASALNLSAVQLHGDEQPDFCEQLGTVKIIKALRVGRDFDLSSIEKYSVDMVLLDSSIEGTYGGTGRRFDWRIALDAKRLAPIILAGGLTADNVREAITYVSPAAIDVCSGVEAEPGRKDLQKLRAFMEVVARTNAEIAGETDRS
jgi:phosphoribosylanthranilate isomerase